MRHVLRIFIFASFLSAQTFESVIQKLEQSPVEQRRKIIEQYLNTKKTSPIIEQDSILHFVLYGAAESVAVIGNIQQWQNAVPLQKISCGEFSFFHSTFIVPSDARLDYQLIINGKFRTDPQNPRITPSGFGLHSEVQMPKFIRTPYIYYRSDIWHGVIDSIAPLVNIPAPLNHYFIARRPIKVYRPAGYDTLAALPSVYVHDGFEAIDYALVPTILDNLIAEGKIPPVIAVFIPPVNRENEYVGNAMDRFAAYLAKELVPLIDAMYRTSRTPSYRAMTGISDGGSITLTTALTYPELFGNAGIQSGSITTVLSERTRVAAAAGKFPAGLRIYMDCGRYDIPMTGSDFDHLDFLTIHRRYDSLLTSFRIPHYYKEVNDGHEWASWRERFPDMMLYFFGGRQ